MEEIEVPELCITEQLVVLQNSSSYALKVLPHYELEAFPNAFGTAEDRWEPGQAGFHRTNSTNSVFPVPMFSPAC